MFITCYLEDEQGIEYKVIADVVIEPAQNGGMTDPSWPASWHIESVCNMDGVDLFEFLIFDDIESVSQQVIQHFEDIANDR